MASDLLGFYERQLQSALDAGEITEVEDDNGEA